MFSFTRDDRNRPCVLYQGLTPKRFLDKENKEKIFGFLAKNQLKKLHHFLEEKYQKWDMMGIDAYCPECDKIYCRSHYHPIPERENGYYDCTYATCPENHRRMIDD